MLQLSAPAADTLPFGHRLHSSRCLLLPWTDPALHRVHSVDANPSPARQYVQAASFSDPSALPEQRSHLCSPDGVVPGKHVQMKSSRRNF